jgi:hypothetical protein
MEGPTKKGTVDERVDPTQELLSELKRDAETLAGTYDGLIQYQKLQFLAGKESQQVIEQGKLPKD